ncbi:MAG TPA: fumarylacetoacetate hydrolase family protein [Candidatus Limnocylindrales bacterium]|nr:fumarylacetoacetate hydrolase family protein [Candidatus Limnocylindrales bacterium]
MRLATYSASDGSDRLGLVVDDERLIDLAAAAPEESAFASMLAFIDGGTAARDRATRELERLDRNGSEPAPALVPLADVRLRAPIPHPRRNVFCVGMNYRSHVDDNARALGMRADVGDVPLFFSKPTTAVVGPGDPILLDERLTAKLDYEVELAIVVGRGGTWIPESQAFEHVFGYTIVNDVSARDLQWRTSQMFIGKGLDSYCPIGPWIALAEPAAGNADAPPFELSCLVNGEVRQQDTSANLIFPVARIVAELSKGLTLEPGDVIATGTPGGCGYQLQPPRFLAVGDVVECRAEGIGSLVNPVAPWSPEAVSRRDAMEVAR